MEQPDPKAEALGWDENEYARDKPGICRAHEAGRRAARVEPGPHGFATPRPHSEYVASITEIRHVLKRPEGLALATVHSALGGVVHWPGIVAYVQKL